MALASFMLYHNSGYTSRLPRGLIVGVFSLVAVIIGLGGCYEVSIVAGKIYWQSQ